MKIKDVIRMVCKETKRTNKDVEPIVRAVEKVVIEAVMDYGEEIVMMGGRFYRRKIKASKRTNPQTHEQFMTPEKYSMCYYSTRSHRRIVPGQKIDEHGHLIVDGGNKNEN